MRVWVEPKRRHKAAHTDDVNWAPLSEVMVSGTPNLHTQEEQRAAAQEAADVSLNGTASAQRVVLSIMVKTYV